MTAQPSAIRQIFGWKVVLTVVIVAFVAIPIGYRVWAYNGWIEFKLICNSSDHDRLVLTGSPTPEMLESIDIYFTEMATNWENGDRIFYRQGSQFFMRPWFYYNGLGARIYDAGEITRHVTGNWFGEHYCMNIYDDPRLYSPYNKHKSKTNYISCLSG